MSPIECPKGGCEITVRTRSAKVSVRSAARGSILQVQLYGSGQRTRPRTRPVFPLYTLDRTHEDPTMPPYTTGSVRDRGQEGRTLQSTAVQSTVEEVSCLNAQWVTR